MALFWAAIKKDSVSLFSSYVHVFSCAVAWNILTVVFLPISVFEFLYFSFYDSLNNTVIGSYN